MRQTGQTCFELFNAAIKGKIGEWQSASLQNVFMLDAFEHRYCEGFNSLRLPRQFVDAFQNCCRKTKMKERDSEQGYHLTRFFDRS